MAKDRTTRGLGAKDRSTRGKSTHLGACGCPKGARKISAGKSGFRCYAGNKMVKQVKRKKAGESCWAAPKKRTRARKKKS